MSCMLLYLLLRVFVMLVTKAELQESAADINGKAVKTAVSLVKELPA